MSAFTDFLINSLSGALAQVGEVKLEAVLQSLHTNNVAEWEAAVRGGHALCIALKPLVDGTGTKIDDAILGALHDAIQASATANGITL